MNRFPRLFFVFCVAFISAAPLIFAQNSTPTVPDVIKVHGAVPVAVPVVEAAKILLKENNLQVQTSTSGGTADGIMQLGNGSVDIALSTRPVTAEERAASPAIRFTEIPIGLQAIALAVPAEVWNGGVRALSQNEVQGIYEGTIKNWKEVGGPDLKITLFMSERGLGLLEMFLAWIYGDVKKAPYASHPSVTSYEEAKNALEFTQGSITQIPMSYIDNHSFFALSIKGDGNSVIDPTAQNFANGSYPLCRNLLLVVNERPTLNVKVFVNFMLSDRGQEIIRKSSLVPLGDVQIKEGVK